MQAKLESSRANDEPTHIQTTRLLLEMDDNQPLGLVLSSRSLQEMKEQSKATSNPDQRLSQSETILLGTCGPLSPGGGTPVAWVSSIGLASRAGIQQYDVITEVAGVDVRDMPTSKVLSMLKETRQDKLSIIVKRRFKSSVPNSGFFVPELEAEGVVGKVSGAPRTRSGQTIIPQQNRPLAYTPPGPSESHPPNNSNTPPAFRPVADAKSPAIARPPPPVASVNSDSFGPGLSSRSATDVPQPSLPPRTKHVVPHIGASLSSEPTQLHSPSPQDPPALIPLPNLEAGSNRAATVNSQDAIQASQEPKASTASVLRSSSHAPANPHKSSSASQNQDPALGPPLLTRPSIIPGKQSPQIPRAPSTDRVSPIAPAVAIPPKSVTPTVLSPTVLHRASPSSPFSLPTSTNGSYVGAAPVTPSTLPDSDTPASAAPTKPVSPSPNFPTPPSSNASNGSNSKTNVPRVLITRSLSSPNDSQKPEQMWGSSTLTRRTSIEDSKPLSNGQSTPNAFSPSATSAGQLSSQSSFDRSSTSKPLNGALDIQTPIFSEKRESLLEDRERMKSWRLTDMDMKLGKGAVYWEAQDSSFYISGSEKATLSLLFEPDAASNGKSFSIVHGRKTLFTATALAYQQYLLPMEAGYLNLHEFYKRNKPENKYLPGKVRSFELVLKPAEGSEYVGHAFCLEESAPITDPVTKEDVATVFLLSVEVEGKREIQTKITVWYDLGTRSIESVNAVLFSDLASPETIAGLIFCLHSLLSEEQEEADLEGAKVELEQLAPPSEHELIHV